MYGVFKGVSGVYIYNVFYMYYGCKYMVIKVCIKGVYRVYNMMGHNTLRLLDVLQRRSGALPPLLPASFTSSINSPPIGEQRRFIMEWV